MGRNYLRRGVWAAALLASFALFGEHSAFAWNMNQPRVEGAGWFFKHTADGSGPCGFLSGSGGCEVKFSVTANYSSNFKQQGHWEYFNTVTGLKVHGKINELDNTTHCSDPTLATAPTVHVHGDCDNDADDGTGCQLDMVLVDNDGSSPPAPGNDFVCDFTAGPDSKGNMESEIGSEPLVKGRIEIKQGH